MTPTDVIREMREAGNEPQGHGEHAVTCDDVFRWADAIEAAMQEPVATMTLRGVLREPGKSIPFRTKLYALPPDAAGEIQNLQFKIEACEEDYELEKERALLLEEARAEIEHWRDEAKRFAQNVEHWRQETGWRNAEIDRLRSENIDLEKNIDAIYGERNMCEQALSDKDVEIEELQKIIKAHQIHADALRVELERMYGLNKKLEQDVDILSKAIQCFKAFDDLTWQEKRPDIFELKVRRPLLIALNLVSKENCYDF